MLQDPTAGKWNFITVLKINSLMSQKKKKLYLLKHLYVIFKINYRGSIFENYHLEMAGRTESKIYMK